MGNIRLILYKKYGSIVTDTPFFSQLFDGVAAQCQSSGYSLSISQIEEGRANTNHLSECDGIIVLTTEIQKAI